MSIQSSLNDAARRWLRSIGTDDVGDVDEVHSVTQEVEQTGVCDTCRHDEIVVYINYTDRDGEWHQYTYVGDLGAFIRALDEGQER